MKRSHLWLYCSAAVAFGALSLAACGSRTGLELEPYPPGFVDDASLPDAPTQGRDAAELPDGYETRDVVSRDAARDVSPPDATPLADASDAAPDAPSDDGGFLCPDGGVTAAYIWGESGTLYTFDPATLATTPLGVVSCPSSSTPWTLSVSRAGFAYFMYEDWRIYRVDLTTLACTPTLYQEGQLGFTGQESIAVSRDLAAEQLYVYGMPSTAVPTLGESDLTDFTLSTVGEVTPNPNAFPLDMQADAFGHLFALSRAGVFIELDAVTGSVLARTQTAFASSGSWAIMTWNEQLFLFGDDEVSSYDPATNQVTFLGFINDSIVGASAAACIH